jgi:hypothetical protein
MFFRISPFLKRDEGGFWAVVKSSLTLLYTLKGTRQRRA